MTLYMLKFYCARTNTACLVRDGFKTRREAYLYRDASVGWGPGEFRVHPYFGGR